MKNNILIGILMLGILFLLIRSCGTDNKTSSLKDQVALEKSFTDSVKAVYNKKTGEIEYSKQTLAAELGQLTDFLAEKDKQLYELQKTKKASVGIISNTEWRIDTVVINIPPVEPSNFDSIRTAVIQTKDYRADIKSWPNKTSLGLSAWDTVKYSIDKDYRLTASHSFKNLKVTELNSFYVKPDVKKKNWKYVVGGIIVGGFVYGLTN